MILSVAVDLVTAVLIGVFIANLVTIRRLSEIQLDNLSIFTDKEIAQLPSDEKALFEVVSNEVLLLNISGPIGFGVARGLKQSVSQIDQNKTILVDFTHARFVGITSTIAIEEIILSYQNQGKDILLVCLCERVRQDFDKIKLLDKIDEKYIFKTRKDALLYMNKR
jgi:SulP family sulfate permease